MLFVSNDKSKSPEEKKGKKEKKRTFGLNEIKKKHCKTSNSFNFDISQNKPFPVTFRHCVKTSFFAEPFM